ncbi:LexA family transcriptional regulator [Acinetobacter sp. Marseille-Q1618]|uniref:LexA family protein n=1 Tax=Acinetobacter sp. Marseille-Q1618 TaxID=2697502 RepID=UPI00156E028C|nr:translesion error-prone DNA polymerase V autoproteolytic subunit [Acinetobacter sp. Marseille-Q1618]
MTNSANLNCTSEVINLSSTPDEDTEIVRVPKSQVNEVKQYLNNKAQKQKIREVASISIFECKTSAAIPLAQSKIAAGLPSPVQDYTEQSIDFNEYLIRNPNTTFVVKVASLSMLGAGIDVDDDLIVDRSIPAKNRNIVVALVDNDFTVKRLMIEGEKKWLQAENPEFPDIHFNDGQEMVIWGVVTRVIKNLK